MLKKQASGFQIVLLVVCFWSIEFPARRQRWIQRLQISSFLQPYLIMQHLKNGWIVPGTVYIMRRPETQDLLASG